MLQMLLPHRYSCSCQEHDSIPPPKVFFLLFFSLLLYNEDKNLHSLPNTKGLVQNVHVEELQRKRLIIFCFWMEKFFDLDF